MSVADRPAAREDRIVALDVLRGVAVGGILLANAFVFFGLLLLFDPDGHCSPKRPWNGCGAG